PRDTAVRARTLVRRALARRGLRPGVVVCERAHRRSPGLRPRRLRPSRGTRVARAPCVTRGVASVAHSRAVLVERAGAVRIASHARRLLAHARARGARSGCLPALGHGAARTRGMAAGGVAMRRAWRIFDRWFPWIALVAVSAGIGIAVRSQWPAI